MGRSIFGVCSYSKPQAPTLGMENTKDHVLFPFSQQANCPAPNNQLKKEELTLTVRDSNVVKLARLAKLAKRAPG